MINLLFKNVECFLISDCHQLITIVMGAMENFSGGLHNLKIPGRFITDFYTFSIWEDKKKFNKWHI